MNIRIKKATEFDEAGIDALIRAERLRPTGNDWRRFIVATDPAGVVAAVQMRQYEDGTKELGSLVVRGDLRGRGLGERLIRELLRYHPGTVYMITYEALAGLAQRTGFTRCDSASAPAIIRRQRLLGQWLGGLFAVLRGYPVRRLVIMRRLDPLSQSYAGRVPPAASHTAIAAARSSIEAPTDLNMVISSAEVRNGAWPRASS
jgi:N-acetylglutamate synthase-like GNAT family acetyltransferase